MFLAVHDRYDSVWRRSPSFEDEMEILEQDELLLVEVIESYIEMQKELKNYHRAMEKRTEELGPKELGRRSMKNMRKL